MTNFTISSFPLALILELDGVTEDELEPGTTLLRDDGGQNDVGSVSVSGTVDNSDGLSVQRDGSFTASVVTSYGPSLSEDELGQLQAVLSVQVSQAFTGTSATFSVPYVLVPITSQAPLDLSVDVSSGFEFSSVVNSATLIPGPSVAYDLSFFDAFVSRTFIDDPVGDRVISFPTQTVDPLEPDQINFQVEAFPGAVSGGFTSFPDGGRVIDGNLKFGTQADFGIDFDFTFRLPTLQISEDQMVEVDGKMVPASEVYVIAGPENAGILGVFPEQIPDELDGFLFEPHNILDVRDITISSRGTDEDGFEAGFEEQGLGLDDNRQQVDGLTLEIPEGVLITQTTLRPEALSEFEENQPVIAIAGENVTIRNAGRIEGLVEQGAGILLGSEAASSGNVIINTGQITTAGLEAPGILVAASGSRVNQTGTIETVGDAAYGLWAIGQNLDITNAGDITTEGTNAFGVMLGTARAPSVIDMIAPDIFEFQRTLVSALDPEEAEAFLARSSGNFVNTGTIETKAAAVIPTEDVDGALAPALLVNFDNETVTNEGTLRAQAATVVLNGKDLTFVNTGDVELTNEDADSTLLGEVAVLVDSFQQGTVQNSGTIGGDVVFSGTDGRLINNGEIDGKLDVGPTGFGFEEAGSFALTTGSGSTLSTDKTENHRLNLIADGGFLTEASFEMVSAGTINGGLSVLAGTQTIVLQGSAARIESDGNIALATTGNVTATLEGAVVSNDADALVVQEFLESSLDLTIGPDGGIAAVNGSGVTAAVSNVININTDGLVSVSGADVQGFDLLSLNATSDITNTGTIEATGVDASAIRTAGGDVLNAGTITATGAGAFGIETGAGTITNAAGGVVSATGAGAAGVFGNAGLSLSEPAQMTLINAGIISGFGGADAVLGSFVDDQVTNSGVFAGDVDLSAGDDTVTWLDGGTTLSAVTGNAGFDSLIARGGTLDGSLFLDFEEFQVDGAVTLTGFLQVPNAIVASGTLELDGVIDGNTKVASGASLVGSGVISGSLEAEDGALLDPGFSPGTLTVEGDATIAGTLIMEVGGPNIGDSDALVVSGTLDLSDATVQIRIIDGYEPAPGTPIRLFDAANVTGLGTADVSVDGLPPGQTLELSPDGTTQFTAADPGNSPPFAVDDPDLVVLEDTPSDLDFLANDSDPDGDPLTVEIVDGPTQGELEFDGTGWRYTPDPNFDSVDSFIYAVSDGEFSDTATATITVDPVNDPPVAMNDSGIGFETDKGSAFTTASVLGNDTDAEGDTLSIAGLDTTGTLGLVTDNGDGTFDYDPNGAFDSIGVGESASDSFSYNVSDGNGGLGNATVTITVNGVADTSDSIVGTDENDDIMNPIGGQRIDLVGGQDVVRGLLENFFGDQIEGLGTDDLLVFEGSEIARSAIDVSTDPVVLAVDTDGDGNSDGQFTLEGDFAGGDFMAVHGGGNTLVTFETFLPVLQESQAVDPNLVNGIINQNFLKGDGTTDFRVTLRDLGFAGFDNVLGVYEIDAAGSIIDPRILFANANADKSASALIQDVEMGHNLGFFIVQDAADWASTLSEVDALSFVNSSGGSANVADGADIAIAVNGFAVDEFVFHSFDESMNFDGVQHALSGVEIGGEAITIGFEDLTGGGDRDYEDVAFLVELVNDLAWG
ncbi:MAG: Ig-like domain-containing protein [Pseudomonadota bacterium]